MFGFAFNVSRAASAICRNCHRSAQCLRTVSVKSGGNAGAVRLRELRGTCAPQKAGRHPPSPLSPRQVGRHPPSPLSPRRRSARLSHDFRDLRIGPGRRRGTRFPSAAQVAVEPPDGKAVLTYGQGLFRDSVIGFRERPKTAGERSGRARVSTRRSRRCGRLRDPRCAESKSCSRGRRAGRVRCSPPAGCAG